MVTRKTSHFEAPCATQSSRVVGSHLSMGLPSESLFLSLKRKLSILIRH